jgi:alkanesulfonate monooxygenase SsuD/methylene tetrahydromethanopterin reductase-like flavin-dependent oxidoreductase (luciferase family)
MPAVVRNPVFSAMEIATIARLFPGRFLPGFGHGVAEWMHQIGAFPRSQLKALEEVTLVVRKLLSGEHIDFRGQHIHVEQAKLVHPPAEIPPISLGVIGPKSLTLSGKVADGTILSEYSNPAYIAWAKQKIEKRRPGLAYSRDHRLTVFGFAHAGKSKTESCRKLRPMISEAILSGGLDVKLAPMGILSQVKALVAQNGREKFKDHFPDSWISELTIAGTTGDWEKIISKLAELGVQSVVLVPLPDSSPEGIKILAKHIF